MTFVSNYVVEVKIRFDYSPDTATIYKVIMTSLVKKRLQKVKIKLS